MAKEQDKPAATVAVVAPVAPAPALARVIDQNERATPGLKRFKIRCANYDRPLPVYILAADEAAARACYLETSGVAALVEAAKASGNDKPDAPALGVVALAD